VEPKVVIVTGASSGIGHAASLELARRGHHVVAAARRVGEMGTLAEAGCTVVGCDVTEDDQLLNLLDEVHRRHRHVDVLVNNAGYGSYGAVEEVPLAEARRQFEVNLFSAARLAQLLLPEMREARSGRIVNVSSMGGQVAFPFGGWYHATKFALEGLSDSMRAELAPFGVRVVLVEPGSIRSEWGAIAAANLIEASADGPYEEGSAPWAAVIAGSSADQGGATAPERVARVIRRAVEARRPKSRYLVGKGARQLVALRHVLPGGLFDQVVGRAVAGGIATRR
jgi:NAD(P)-dependent dehydrogenase (short-subunit alcohol dehydrogenase family)